jgi:hypothetical protein
MTRSLRWSILVTDTLFTLYWAASALIALKLLTVPDEYLFANYHDPHSIAWNWSFLPLDLAFAAFGFSAVRAASLGHASWRMLAVASLVLSSAAGGMAIGYWIILGEFDPAWFLPNLVLFLWPLAFLPGLLSADGRAP